MAGPRLHPRAGGALLGALLVASACGPRAPRERAGGLLLVALDALRADHLPFHGYDRETSPALAVLAREGVRFDQAFSAAPQLMPSHAAILTGCPAAIARRFLVPEYEGASERRWRVPAGAPHLAVELLAAGYATAAFVDAEELSAERGFDAGFQRYEVLARSDAERWEGSETARVVNRFLQWVRSIPPHQPWFAYLDLNQLERGWTEPADAFEGYFQPRAELSSSPPVANTDSAYFAVPRSRWRGGARTLGQYEADYDNEIRALDAELERLFGTLKRLGRLGSTTVHVIGTFGVQFGEAGLVLAAGRYSEADLRVPWIVRPRAGQAVAPGRSVPGLVSLEDVAPTVLALEGLSVPQAMQGLSQARAVLAPEAGAAPRPHVFASCGLQEGCAVIGPEHVLEILFPLRTADAAQRRSWAGAKRELGMQAQLLFYGREDAARPALEGPVEPVSAPEFERYHAAGTAWMRATNDWRRELQSPGGERAAAARRARVREGRAERP
jgi:arylsulfatase A-like enzyme